MVDPNAMVARWVRAMVLLCVGSASAAQPRAWVLDRAVALIDGRTLAQSELEFETRVLLIQGGGIEAAAAPIDHETLKAWVAVVIANRLLAAEADKLNAYTLDEGELQSAVEKFEARFVNRSDFDAFLLRNDATLATLGLVLGRTLRADRVLEGKFRVRSQVSLADAARAQKEQPALAQLSPETVRVRLSQQRFAELAGIEVAQMRRTAQVRLLGPYGTPSPPPEQAR